MVIVLPSTPTIHVRIPLKSTVLLFSVNSLFEKNEKMEKRPWLTFFADHLVKFAKGNAGLLFISQPAHIAASYVCREHRDRNIHIGRERMI